MKTILLFIAGTLAAISQVSATPTSTSAPTPSPTELIKNGGFESCSESKQFQLNTKTCHWTFSGQAAYEIGDVSTGGTPYGDKFAIFFRQKPNQSRGSISQHVSGLSNGDYVLSYDYEPGNYDGNCTLTTTIGSVVIDDFPVPAITNEYWQGPRNVSFTPILSAGLFEIEVVCDPKPGYWEFAIDQVSLTGPYMA